MPRFSKLFGRKHTGETPDPRSDGSGAPDDPWYSPGDADRPDDDPSELPTLPSAGDAPPYAHDGFSAPLSADLSLAEYRLAGDQPASVATAVAEERYPPASHRTLIGGEEADLVAVIPNTEMDMLEQHDHLDEEGIDVATVDALMAACRMMVTRVNVIRRAQDGTQIISGLISLVTDLDAQYASDWGILRRNGLEDVLTEVRHAIAEGDRFILESLETRRGGLTAEVFLRDLRTIAPADRPRMITNYAMFLIFVTKCVLRQYLRPLEHDPARLRDVTRRLDYLVDGVRDTLLARVNGIPRTV